MAQIPLNNGQTYGVIRTAINTMFTEVYAFLASKGAASGLATLGSDSKVPQAQMTGKLATTDLTDVAAAITTPLASKLSNALDWSGTVPALVSGTSPVSAFGSNAFRYSGTGGAVLDGQTYATGDLAIWGMGGLSVFTKIPAGGAYLGVFANTGAFPAAAANPGCSAITGTTLYFSTGAAWAALGAGGSTTLGALTDMGTYDLGVNNPSVAAIKTTANAALPASQKAAASGVASLNASSIVPPAQLQAAATQVTGNKTFAAADDGKPFELTGSGPFTLTFPVSMAWVLGVSIKLPPTATVNFIGDGTSTINDVTTNLTRVKAVGQRIVTVTPGFTANALDLSGQ